MFQAIQGVEESGNCIPWYYQWYLLDGEDVIVTSDVKFPTVLLCQVDAVKNKSLLETNPILCITAYTKDGLALGTVKELVDASVDTRAQKRRRMRRKRPVWRSRKSHY